jgi:hypothetical protein
MLFHCNLNYRVCNRLPVPIIKIGHGVDWGEKPPLRKESVVEIQPIPMKRLQIESHERKNNRTRTTKNKIKRRLRLEINHDRP